MKGGAGAKEKEAEATEGGECLNTPDAGSWAREEACRAVREAAGRAIREAVGSGVREAVGGAGHWAPAAARSIRSVHWASVRRPRQSCQPWNSPGAIAKGAPA